MQCSSVEVCSQESVVDFPSEELSALTIGERESLLKTIVDDMVDEAIFLLALWTHRDAKLMPWSFDDQPDNEEDMTVASLPNGPIKRPIETFCPHCSRMVNAFRFAPHLEKCMGMGGRTSGRLATRRLREDVGNSGDGDDSPEDDTDDWDPSGSSTYPFVTSNSALSGSLTRRPYRRKDQSTSSLRSKSHRQSPISASVVSQSPSANAVSRTVESEDSVDSTFAVSPQSEQ
ncbi:unnamed protein product [Cyprideis torosa]|uniref:SAGA-associated factor 11 n=1 Tax=Cyprideis torosa TaxID=163714 RepID=A0A7R8WAZ7_9CRUS|nr:unnamed protein product [Cyprideis torosa]CAG0886379.1 unnamed protein product [Cyprideis torosa]